MTSGRPAAWWTELRRNHTAAIGMLITLVVLLLATVGGALSPYSPTKLALTQALQPPSLAHPFGTDSFGRDVLTRVIYGGRISLLISVAGVGIATLVGTFVGMVAGYFGGWLDDALMRVMDLLFAFPSYVLALALMVMLGFGVPNVILAIALVYGPIFARLARNVTVRIRGEPYVESARAVGEGHLQIILTEILPNAVAPVIVQASLALAFAIILEAGLSFLGLGVQPPTPSLGVILADGREYFRLAPWVMTLTGVAVTVTLLGFNLLGDGLRDALDPRLAQDIRRA